MGEDEILAQKQIETLFAFAENMNVEHVDVVLRLFVQSLDKEAQKWFKNLLDASINNQQGMENSFMQKWGKRRDHGYILTKLYAIHKKHNEYAIEFIRRFNKLDNSLPAEIKPPKTISKAVFCQEILTIVWVYPQRNNVTYSRTKQMPQKLKEISPPLGSGKGGFNMVIGGDERKKPVLRGMQRKPKNMSQMR